MHAQVSGSAPLKPGGKRVGALGLKTLRPVTSIWKVNPCMHHLQSRALASSSAHSVKLASRCLPFEHLDVQFRAPSLIARPESQ